MENSITFIGLDVHKETISVALAEGGERGEARVYGEIANRPDALSPIYARECHFGGLKRRNQCNVDNFDAFLRPSMMV